MFLACPLCSSTDTRAYHRDKRRQYLQCGHCRLVFVPATWHLNPKEEQREYAQHQNNPDDTGYRRFLSRLAFPLLERLPANSLGLDFGCGPGPTLSLILEQAGHQVALYDKFYALDETIWQQQYTFICATEVVEHLDQPGQVLTRLWQHLKTAGTLAIMTKMVINQERFAQWHYKNDPTHISFFSRETFHWLAGQWQASLEFIGSDVIFFVKN